MSRSFPEKINMLLNRMFEGRLVPFVGAGISLSAKIGYEKLFPSMPLFTPTLDYMKRRLRKGFNEYPQRYQDADMVLVRSLLPRDMGGTGEGAFKTTSFDRLADIAFWLWGAERLCECLQIRYFQYLKPLPAHRYLAYMAREGLIGEIISTNYDCCIEKAYCNSFYPVLKEHKDNGVKVIFNLNTYRSNGGLRQSREGLSALRLYKINGCAKAYVEGAQEAEDILLTERQLQDFGSRRWAHDLLADRARRHSLVFCGFGSEEPQVRHTALAIMDEFSDSGENQQYSVEDSADLPNAPFVAAYDKPTFPQAQILVAFHRAHVNQSRCLDGLQVGDWIAASSLSGHEVRDIPGTNGKLKADDFFKFLFQAAFGRLLVQYTRDNSEFYLWLRGLSGYAGAWRAHILAALYPHTVQIGNEKEDKSPLGSSSALFEIPVVENGMPDQAMPLWQWLYAAYHPENTQPLQQDWYLPLKQDPHFILGVLLVLAGLCFEKNRDADSNGAKPPKVNGPSIATEHVRPTPGYGLAIQVPDAPTVYLVREGSALPPDSAEPAGKGRALFRVSIPSRQAMATEGRWEQKASRESLGGLPVLRIGRYYTVELPEWIRIAERPERLHTAIRRVFASAPSRKPNVILKPL